MPLRPCQQEGCPALVALGERRCPEHRSAVESMRDLRWPWRWVYKDVRWRPARWRCIVRAGFRCQAIERGERCGVSSLKGRGLHAHHRTPVEQILAAGGDPFSVDLLVCLCERHHQQVEEELRRLGIR